jgi:hypothetical protein
MLNNKTKVFDQEIRMEESKDLIKRDLSIIKKLHQKTDYTQTNQIEVIYNYAISKELLKTNLGQKYLKRLLSLKEGTDEVNICIICGKQCEDNPLFCNQCNYKLMNTEREQAIENRGKVPEQVSLKASEKEAKEISENAVKAHVVETTRTNSTVTAESEMKESSTTVTKVKNSKRKGIWKPVGITLVIILIFYAMGRMDNLEGNNDSTSTFDSTSSQIEQNNIMEPTAKVTDGNMEDITLSSQQDKESAKSEQDVNPEDIRGEVEEFEDGEGAIFDFTEEELMGQIQEALAPHQLDIGTKKGYSNVYFVIEGNMASNVVYQIVLDEASKVQTISVNVAAPVETLDVFSKAVATAILICDPTITNDEMKELIAMSGNQEIVTLNGISYVADPLSEDILSFLITKADISDETKIDNSETYSSNSDRVNETVIEDNNVNFEGYDLSSLLGMTAEEVQTGIGYPIDTMDNTKYYSDFLSINYENEVASKIILGLEDRFDFTQLEIPETIYSIDGIYLGDSKETVLANAKDTRVFILDGVFYGNTYQLEQDGYYVNIDFYTLEDGDACPVYRIVMTRLLSVD